MDLVFPGLNVAHGRPLFRDVTCLTFVTGRGAAKPGCLLRSGSLLRRATIYNHAVYHEVVDSGFGRLCCLGMEVFGRWSADVIELVPAMARERARGLPGRVRRGTELALMRRWWDLLGLTVQQAAAHAATREEGEDLATRLLERPPLLADLPVV